MSRASRPRAAWALLCPHSAYFRAALLLLALLPARAAEAAYECFTKPNAIAAAFAAQAHAYEQDWQSLALGVRGTGVIYAAGACAVLPQAAPNMTTRLTTGCTIAVVGATASVTTGNFTHAAADGTNPRFDLAGATNAGTKTVVTGTPAASPLPPTIPDNFVPFAFVYIPTSDTAIQANQITDARPCIPTPGGGGGSGTVTHTVGALTADRLVIGNGAADIEVLGSLGTTTTVLHGNAAGPPSFGAVSLTADVSGDLPYANLTPATAASKLLGRGSAGGAGDWQEITIGSGLTMTTTTLSTSGGGGGDFSSNTSSSVDSEFLLFSGTAGKTGKRATGTGLARAASGVSSFSELSGDVITSGSNVVTISSNAVTYAKMQDVAAASRLLGRGSAAGGGDPQEITLGSGLTMTGTTLAASGGGGNPETWAVVAADVTHAQSSTTLSNITGLAVAVCTTATEVWQIDVQLITVAASNTPDWKFGWTFPTGMTGSWGNSGSIVANDDWGATAAATAQRPLVAENATVSYGSAAVTGGYRFHGTFYCSSTSGTLQLLFAQDQVHASDITIKKGSLMIARKVIS